MPDNVPIKIGTNGDTRIYSTNTLSIYDFYNYDGLFRSLTNDKDIIFQTTTGDAQNEIMRLEGSTTNVGIGGVGSPTAFLHVSKDNDNSGNQFCVADTEGTSAAVRTYTHDGDAQGLIINHYYAEGGSGNEYARYADFVSNVGNGAATKMRFITKNAANTYSTTIIDNEGRLGIGGTPSEKLTVKTNTTVGPSIGLHNSEYQTWINNWGSSATSGRQSRFEINASTTDFAVGADTIRFQIGNVGDSYEKMRIDSSGNVGIGTTSPVSPLTIESTVNALADVDEPENHHLLLRNPANDTTEGVGMAFLVSSLTDDVGASIICKRTDANAKSELQFWNKQNTTSDGVITQAMTISDSGNVCIGNTSAAAKLDIRQDSGVALRCEDGTGAYFTVDQNGDLLLKGSSPVMTVNSTNATSGFRINVTGLDADNDLLFRVQDNGTNRFKINRNGDVGINGDPSANADLTLGNGELCMAETTTPTADANFGKIYCKSDNKLYFQDGAGTEHEIAFV